MKKYVKPQMIIEEFRTDESICTCAGTYTMRRGSDRLNVWRYWNDTNKDGIYQNGEQGSRFDPEYIADGQETPFVITFGGDDGTYGTIVDTYWERVLLIPHLNVVYRNAS